MIQDLKYKTCQEIHNPIPLSSDEIQAYLQEVTSWKISGCSTMIEKCIKLINYQQTVEIVNQIAQIAQQEDHHPDIHFSYNQIKVVLSTHSIKALSLKDFIMAYKIDQLVRNGVS